jgi:hypothetical protein
VTTTWVVKIATEADVTTVLVATDEGVLLVLGGGVLESEGVGLEEVVDDTGVVEELGVGDCEDEEDGVGDALELVVCFCDCVVEADVEAGVEALLDPEADKEMLNPPVIADPRSESALLRSPCLLAR